jgi:N6-adenosine-specific RNA methylase IME4
MSATIPAELCTAWFSTVVADPPWRYRDTINAKLVRQVQDAGYGSGKPAGRRGAEGHYPTMTTEQIKALPVIFVAKPNAHLYLWTTNAFMEDAHRVARAWGFLPKTILTWVKPRIGMGHYFRNTTEHVLFAVRGRLGTKVHNLRTDFSAPQPDRQHSRKPDRLLEIVEAASPGPYLELFARRSRDGWSCWGNEL